MAEIETVSRGLGSEPQSLKKLWQHRELLWQFTQRSIEIRHKGSHLGLVWAILNPLLMLTLYVFVFGYIFKGRFGSLPNETPMDYALAVYLGLTVFHLFAETLGSAPAIIVANPNFVKKVVFPLAILPVSNVAASLFHVLMSLTLVLLGIAFFGPGLTVQALWLPLILVPIILLSLGVAWLLSALGVFFRDIGQVVGFLGMAIMFASAIFYPVSSIPAAAWDFLRFNPILLAIELARDVLMWNHPIDLWQLGYLFAVSSVFCAFGYWVFRRTAPAFADVL